MADNQKYFSGELKKMGRQTKLWLTRYYVLTEGILYAFSNKSEKVPKCKAAIIICCRGYFPSRTLL